MGKSANANARKLPSVQEIEPSKIFCNAIVEEKRMGVGFVQGAGIWLLDRSMTVIWMNDVMEKIYGPLKKVRGKNCFKVFRGRNSRCTDCLPTQSFESGNIISGYVSRVTKDGVKRFYQLIEAPLLDEDDQVSRVMEIVLDVTKQTRLEENLRKSEAEYRALFRHAGTAVLVNDRKGRILKVNEMFEELSGYKKEEIEGKLTYEQFIHPRDRQRIAAFSQTRLENPSKAPGMYEFWFINRWGEEKLIQISVNVIPNGLEIVSLIDITEKWKLEQEVRSKEQFLADVLQHSADAIIAMDPAGFIQTWNHGAETIFGYPAKKMLGTKFSRILSSKDRKEFLSGSVFEEYRKKGFVKNLTMRARRKDGKEIQINITRTKIRDDRNRELGSSMTIRDVTESRKLQQRVIQQEKMLALGELAASLAHEIKNPLNSMVINTEVLRSHITQLLPEERLKVTRYFDVLTSEIQRLDKVIQGVLDFSKPLEGEYKPISIDHVIQYVIDLTKAEARRNEFQLHYSKEDHLPEIEGVEDHLKQVFLNLVLNAFQAIHKKGGKVEIRARKIEKDKIQVMVCDNGIGIPKQNRRRIFDLYFSTKEKGSGLGLPLVKQIIQAHHGEITFETRLNHGTTFYVTLPTR